MSLIIGYWSSGQNTNAEAKKINSFSGKHKYSLCYCNSIKMVLRGCRLEMTQLLKIRIWNKTLKRYKVIYNINEQDRQTDRRTGRQMLLQDHGQYHGFFFLPHNDCVKGVCVGDLYQVFGLYRETLHHFVFRESTEFRQQNRN